MFTFKFNSESVFSYVVILSFCWLRYLDFTFPCCMRCMLIFYFSNHTGYNFVRYCLTIVIPIGRIFHLTTMIISIGSVGQ